MHFITACDENLKDLYKIWSFFIKKHGYDYTVYDLGGLGEGKPFENHPNNFTQRAGFVPCYFKPEIIKDALKEHDFVVYMDVDTLLNDKIDEVVGDYDIGATVRTSEEVEKYKNNDKVGRYNTGVLFFRPTLQAKRFIENWIVATHETGIEQQAFNSLSRRNLAKIQEFPTEKYNNYYFNGGTPKITHYKSSFKNKMKKVKCE